MDVSEFRKNVSVGAILQAGSQDFEILQVIKFRLDNGDYYIKCFLSNDYIFADDLEENIFLLVRETNTPFELPFDKRLEYDGKIFNFSYTAHAIAEDTKGQEIFKKGESERFWDYEAKDGSYLSLGKIDSTNVRMDMYGKIVLPSEVSIRQ